MSRHVGESLVPLREAPKPEDAGYVVTAGTVCRLSALEVSPKLDVLGEDVNAPVINAHILSCTYTSPCSDCPESAAAA